jgi:hypothetical protein
MKFSLPVQGKVNALRNISMKMKSSGSKMPLDRTFKNDSEPSARVQRETNPDYAAKKKSILSGKLFNK